MHRPLLTIAALLALATPAAAEVESVYACANGAFVTINSYEARVSVKGGDGWSIALPFAGAMGRFATWSPRGQDAVGERVAPFVEAWQPKVGERQVTFNLGSGEVQCRPIR